MTQRIINADRPREQKFKFDSNVRDRENFSMSSFKYRTISSPNHQEPISDHQLANGHPMSQPVIRDFTKFDYDNMATQKDIKYPDPPILPSEFTNYDEVVDDNYDYNHHYEHPVENYYDYHDQPQYDNDIEHHPHDIIIEEIPIEVAHKINSKVEDTNLTKNKPKRQKKQKEVFRVVDENIAEEKITPIDQKPHTERNQSRRKTPKSQSSKPRNQSSDKVRQRSKKSKQGINEEKVIQNFEKFIGKLTRNASRSIDA